MPRLVCWYGDPGPRIAMLKVDHDPLPWTPQLAELRMRIAERAACPSNSVLGNWLVARRVDSIEVVRRQGATPAPSRVSPH
ncbi:MAG: hypothetical protein U1E83_04550 [Methylotetracoccus sp.]